MLNVYFFPSICLTNNRVLHTVWCFTILYTIDIPFFMYFQRFRDPFPSFVDGTVASFTHSVFIFENLAMLSNYFEYLLFFTVNPVVWVWVCVCVCLPLWAYLGCVCNMYTRYTHELTRYFSYYLKMFVSKYASKIYSKKAYIEFNVVPFLKMCEKSCRNTQLEWVRTSESYECIQVIELSSVARRYLFFTLNKQPNK